MVSGSGILIVLISFCNLRPCLVFFFLVSVCLSISELVAPAPFTSYCTRILHKINFSLPLPLRVFYLAYSCHLTEVVSFLVMRQKRCGFNPASPHVIRMGGLKFSVHGRHRCSGRGVFFWRIPVWFTTNLLAAGEEVSYLVFGVAILSFIACWNRLILSLWL